MALLIVDVQVGFVPLVWRGDELVRRIAALATTARVRGIPVIAVQQTGVPFAEGTDEWRLHPGLGEVDDIIQKPATDSFFRTDLAERLAASHVDTLVITGVATDYCVDATARAALSHGLDVVLVADGHVPAAVGDPQAGLTPRQIVDHHNAVLANATHPGGHLSVVPAADVFG